MCKWNKEALLVENIISMLSKNYFSTSRLRYFKIRLDYHRRFKKGADMRELIHLILVQNQTVKVKAKKTKFLPYLGAPRVTTFSRKKYVLGVDN